MVGTDTINLNFLEDIPMLITGYNNLINLNSEINILLNNISNKS